MFCVNVAVTLLAEVIDTSQVREDSEQSPVHPTKVEPAEALAYTVTIVPELKFTEQVAPQLIPAGDDEIVALPAPVPAFVTDSV